MAAVDLELIILKYLDAYGGPETTDSGYLLEVTNVSS